MDKVTLNIILVLLISFIICFLVYLGIILILVPYWDKENEKENEKKNNKSCCSTAQNFTLKRFLNSGQKVSTLEQDGIYYKPYFDKEKGLYIPMVVVDISSRSNPFGLIQKNVIYYQLIPLSVLSDIRNHFEEEITQALLKNNKGNNNKENNEQGE